VADAVLTLARDARALGARSVLCLGAHCDDIEVGCAGTLLKLFRGGGVEMVTWVVLTSTPERAAEARASARTLLRGVRNTRIVVADFRDGFLPYEGGAVKQRFEALKPTVAPDLIFTPSRDDRHQDHRLVAELTWNTFRDHRILEYEIPKWDGDFGSPNVFVPLDRTLADRKVRHLMRAFPSQRGRHWYTEDVFRAVLRLRGMEANARSGYAEAFTGRKLVLL
jgi:LmbE family N-acetylglucosaminyl deacetylase